MSFKPTTENITRTIIHKIDEEIKKENKKKALNSNRMKQLNNGDPSNNSNISLPNLPNVNQTTAFPKFGNILFEFSLFNP
jgi:ERCC4-type nuclease